MKKNTIINGCIPAVFLYLMFTTPLFAAALTQPVIEIASQASYKGIYDNQTIALKKGHWQGKAFVSGSVTYPRVGLIKDFYFTGDVNQDGQKELLVFLWESSGGSGTRIYMAILDRHDKQWINIATTLVGDRVELQMGRVHQGRIELDVIQADGNDPACCPTHKVLRQWTYQAGKLQEQEPTALGQISIKDLLGVNWQLVKMNWKEKLPQAVRISLQFKSNGSQYQVTGNSGCNRFNGALKEGKTTGNISIGPVAGTRMACDQELMFWEDKFLKALSHTRSYSFINGNLALEWQDEAAVSTMFFKPVNKP